MVLGTWARVVAWNVVAQLFGFHWNTVRKAVKNLVDFGLENRDLQNVLYIGIDNISRMVWRYLSCSAMGCSRIIPAASASFAAA